MWLLEIWKHPWSIDLCQLWLTGAHQMPKHKSLEGLPCSVLMATRQKVGISCCGVGSSALRWVVPSQKESRDSAPEGVPWHLNPVCMGQLSQQTSIYLLMKRQQYVLGEKTFSRRAGIPRRAVFVARLLTVWAAAAMLSLPYDLQSFLFSLLVLFYNSLWKK